MMMKYFENIVFITITVLVQTFMYNIIRYKITLQLKVINIVTMSYFPTFKSKSKRTFNEYSPNVNIFWDDDVLGSNIIFLNNPNEKYLLIEVIKYIYKYNYEFNAILYYKI